ncbi:CutC family protein [Gaeumannomyces tritici R3-111a-1]|uniref:Copper homeostasis protein cutC homolog n=1 Tax=Gaeumannomyces tritici (strain R3-111a-1) TaxID=644352 RepID=J3NXW0_GAET3|nr:CutC family protein [Gaeumannomyces tritici R3-111a-1]EJT76193.1 CutC family protein [Gaeumannomyces tritici R3-111a-1]
MAKRKLEIPVFSPSAASEAANLGAHRIELNAAGSYPAGGLTPSLAELSDLLHQLQQPSQSAATATSDGAALPPPSPRIPVRVMIRPRGAPPPPPPTATADQPPPPDFIYTDAELAAMRDAIRAFVASGLLDASRGDGFVLGVLRRRRRDDDDDDGGGRLAVDVPRNSDLVALARPFPCVFHRAFDDVLAGGGDGDGAVEGGSLDDVVACGFVGVLTSGGPGSAAGDGNVRALRRVVALAAGRVEVVVGGGVRSGNVGALAAAIDDARGDVSGERWFHSSCLTGGGGGESGIDRDEAAKLLNSLAVLDG